MALVPTLVGPNVKGVRQSLELKTGWPGLRALVAYDGDAGWHHERLLLWSVRRHRWVVLTPDGDMYDEEFADYATALVMTGMTRYPGGAVSVVAFDEALGPAEMLKTSRMDVSKRIALLWLKA